MRVTTTAPGKVVLLGEYAVLEGGAALTMAVDRYAQVDIGQKAEGDCTICAPALYPHTAYFCLSEDGNIQWLEDKNEQGYQFFGVLQSVAETLSKKRVLRFEIQPHLDISLDSTALFLANARDGCLKLGLGSSAALTTALAHALVEYAGQPKWPVNRWMPILLEAHRRFQGGQGSGVDVAASLYGGLVEYQWINKRPCANHLTLPSGLKFVFVWSGQPASTHELLGQLRSWRGQHRVDYDNWMGELSLISAGGIEAVKFNDSAAFLEAVDQFASVLSRLGTRAGLEIFNSAHRDLAAIAKRSRLVYKPCGAGGGDLGVAMGVQSEDTKHFVDLVKNSGYQTIDIAFNPEGVQTIRSQ